MVITESWYLYGSEDSEISAEAKRKLEYVTGEGIQDIIHLTYLEQGKLKESDAKLRIKDFRIC